MLKGENVLYKRNLFCRPMKKNKKKREGDLEGVIEREGDAEGD